MLVAMEGYLVQVLKHMKGQKGYVQHFLALALSGGEGLSHPAALAPDMLGLEGGLL